MPGHGRNAGVALPPVCENEDRGVCSVALKLHIPAGARLSRLLLHPVGKALMLIVLLVGTAILAGFTYYYVKFARLIDAKLASGPYQRAAMIFAAPRTVSLNDQMTIEEVVTQLRRSGYTESRSNRMGWYNLRPDAVEIFPGPDSYFDQEGGVIQFSKGRVSQIISTRDNTARTQYLLEPQLLTNMYQSVGARREKRREVKFADLPKSLVQAVLSAEDKRFFQHAGFDPFRIIKVAFLDLKEGRLAAGASTLTMQLAGTVWLDRSQRTWKRKAAEVLITLHLERKLSKEQIFEHYANTIDIGSRGSFGLRGFGEAAQAYFGKDVHDLTLPEAAALAGFIQRPGATNPVLYPERARQRRNVVLGLMLENGYITTSEYAEAVASPLTIAKSGIESSDAPYFVDLVNNQLREEFEGHDFQRNSYRIYTTLDMDLQRDAAEAVRLGMEEADKLLKKQREFRGGKTPDEQVALIALDAKTGEIKALIGGRNYGMSQLNHVLAKRQPGSSFKPFVYAAALEHGINGGGSPITPMTMVMDEPTTFYFDGNPYNPGNFGDQYEHRMVTLRFALSKSKNVPTVRLGEMIGFDKVVDVARRAGMNLNIQPTPAVALGAYEVTPLEIAGAYTVFPNYGTYVAPNWIKVIRDNSGKVLYSGKPKHHEALDPRVAYLMVDMLEEVLRSGTGAGVRSRGFTLPAAGKTGTSRDGWFAGFTSRLICIVWVGFDDNRELNLEGAHSALPVWVEFMKRAHSHREYRNVSSFESPDGIVMVNIDPLSGGLATTRCPGAQLQAFVAGTQPVEACRLHGGALLGATQVTSWDTASEPLEQAGASTATAPAPAAPVGPTPRPKARSQAAKAEPKPAPPEKKGFFGRLLDMFK
jgi:penicillin-binding protein 1B